MGCKNYKLNFSIYVFRTIWSSHDCFPSIFKSSENREMRIRVSFLGAIAEGEK